MFITFLLLLLWTLLGMLPETSSATVVLTVFHIVIFSCPFRYSIIEDFGSMIHFRHDWPGFVIHRLPHGLSCAAIMTFNGISHSLSYPLRLLHVWFIVLALVRYRSVKQEGIDSDHLRHHPSVRTRKLLLVGVLHAPLAACGVYNQVIREDWSAPKSLAENIAPLQLVVNYTRSVLDTDSFTSMTYTTISVLLFGLELFAWFGFWSGTAQGLHRGGLESFGLL
jgi:hypothetical protein